MNGPVVATRLELRSLWGHLGLRVLLVVALVHPLVFYVFGWLFSLVHNSSPDLFLSLWARNDEGLTPVPVLAAVAFAATIGTVSHRHRVFQAYAVTGFPRDLLFVGRLGAAATVTVAIVVTSTAITLVLQQLTEWYLRARGGEAARRLREATDFDLAHNLADAASVGIVALLGALFVVGLCTATRNAGFAAAAVAAALFVENVAIDVLRGRWDERASDLPLSQAATVPVSFPDPWWSVAHALPNVMFGHPHQHEWRVGVTLLAFWALVACTLGFYRLLWRDA